MFRILRYYSIASLVSILAAAALMAIVYRTVAIQGIVSLAETNNLVLANMALSPVRSALVDYLTTSADNARQAGSATPLPPMLDSTISDLLSKESRIAKIKIHNQDGRIGFSTVPGEVGTDSRSDAGFAGAIGGKITGTFTYRDDFNAFDQKTADDNLVQSYIPIRRDPAGPVIGVFEVNTDVNEQVKQLEQAEFRILGGATLIFAALYAALVLIVRRARNIISLQQQSIQEQNTILEQLSESNQRREELERKKLAAELHEGLAQTLSAIKMEVENAQRQASGVASNPLPMEAVVPGLQAAIQQTRTIATDLHPSSLDDLGLLPTINAFCREYATVYPWVRVRRQIAVKEESIPAPLKIVIYRVIETALKIIARQRTADEARVTLELHDRTLTLIVDANRPPSTHVLAPAISSAGAERRQSIQSVANLTVIGGDTQSQLGAIRERTVLSGGRLLIEGNDSGGTRLHAWWQVRDFLAVAPQFPAMGPLTQSGRTDNLKWRHS